MSRLNSTHRVDERVVLIAGRPTTMGMFAAGSFVPEPPFIVGFVVLPTGDFVGGRSLAAAFAF